MAAALAAGCTLRAGPGESGGDEGGTPDARAGADAPLAAPDAAAPDAFPVLGAFGTPERIDDVSDPEINEDDPSMTGDRLELYFNRGGDILVATREAPGDPWGAAETVTELSSADTETTPRVAYDGLALVFASDRAGGGGGGLDLWISTRSSRAEAWSAPEALTELNSEAGDLGAAIDPTRTMLVFHSQRDGNGELYLSTRNAAEEPWGEPAPIAGVNTSAGETSPFLARGGRALYFGSNRSGGDRLYVAERTSLEEPFAAPQAVEGVDSPDSESDVWISEDERRILFTSDRGGLEDLYRATR